MTLCLVIGFNLVFQNNEYLTNLYMNTYDYNIVYVFILIKHIFMSCLYLCATLFLSPPRSKAADLPAVVRFTSHQAPCSLITFQHALSTKLAVLC